jgi:hypothetical protein
MRAYLGTKTLIPERGVQRIADSAPNHTLKESLL